VHIESIIPKNVFRAGDIPIPGELGGLHQSAGSQLPADDTGLHDQQVARQQVPDSRAVGVHDLPGPLRAAQGAAVRLPVPLPTDAPHTAARWVGDSYGGLNIAA